MSGRNNQAIPSANHQTAENTSSQDLTREPRGFVQRDMTRP